MRVVALSTGHFFSAMKERDYDFGCLGRTSVLLLFSHFPQHFTVKRYVAANSQIPQRNSLVRVAEILGRIKNVLFGTPGEGVKL